MRWWETQVGGPTRGRLIALLRRGVRTVDELAAELEVTDNAVRAQLQLLVRAEVVCVAGTRLGDGAGKPATLYRIAPDAEAELSTAYAPVLSTLLETLAERMPASELDDALRATGRRIAEREHTKGATLEARVKSAAAFLTALGGEIEVQRVDSGFRIVGYVCSLSAAVAVQPNMCHVIEELVASIAQAPVRECCDRSDDVRCRIDVMARLP